MIILVINCGSSSIKYQLLDMKSNDVYSLLAKGIVEKIGLPTSRIQHTPTGRNKVVKDLPIPDHKEGMLLSHLTSDLICSTSRVCSKELRL